MRFRARVLLAGKTATGIRVPAKVVESLGSSERPPVRVTINGFTYRSTVASFGGVFMIGISAEVREVSVPADFAVALKRDAVARRFFDTLSYSNRRRFVLLIEGAKTPETRERRIASAIDRLHEGRT